MMRAAMLVVLSLVAMVGGVAGTGQAAEASVGGCSTYDVRGYNVGVCIDDRGSTSAAFPDIYVNRSAGTASCQIQLSVWNDQSTRFSARFLPCAAGHYLGYPTPFVLATNAHAFARLDLGGSSFGIGDSPPVRLAIQGHVSYDLDFVVRDQPAAPPILGHAADAMAELHRCFNCSFPVANAPQAYPNDDQFIPLNACLPPFSLSQCAAPVRAYTDTSQNFYFFIAQPGHFDGAGSIVRFQFPTDSAGRLHLFVTGFVVAPSIPESASRAGASNAWGTFAARLATNLIRRCGGTFCS
jgi:hypothetical protein